MARKVKKYEVEVEGRKAEVTVPETHNQVAYAGEATEVLRDVLRDSLSPEAVAIVAACVDPEVVKDAKVAREVKWFRDLLVKMVGSEEAIDRVCAELWV